MKCDLSVSDLLTKIRDANCLTESESEALSAALTEMQTRRDVDAIDLQWENDMRKYVSLRKHKGGGESLMLTSRSEVFGGMFAGVVLSCWGSYMAWQFLKDLTKAGGASVHLPLFFFVLVLAVGGWAFITSFRKRRAVSGYEEKHNAYLARRKELTDRLPAGSRFPVRYCPHCLSRVWRSSQHPSIPPY